jgi:hypothetical protein
MHCGGAVLARSRPSSMHIRLCHLERSDAAQHGVAKSKDPENLSLSMQLWGVLAMLYLSF